MVFIYQNRHHLYISDYIWKMGFDFTCHPFQRIILHKYIQYGNFVK